MPKRRLTLQEFYLAVALGVMGWVFSLRAWLLLMNALSAWQGFLIYYAIIYGTIYILSMLGLVLFGKKVTNWSETFGAMILTFGYFVVVNWENPYVQLVTTGSLNGASPVFYQSEDGMTWFFWASIIPPIPQNIQLLRFLTFMLTPFLAGLVGGYLLRHKIRLPAS